MENRFYFKKYISIYKALDKLCIGFVGNFDKYLEMDYNDTNYILIENILKNGIPISQLDQYPNNEFLEKDFIEISSYDGNSRSELYLDYLLQNKGTNLDVKKNKRILIFGAGAGGSTLIYLLAQFGFNNLFIVDYDNVEENDLYRVMTFDRNDIGSKKIDALKGKIYTNFEIEINIISENFVSHNDLLHIVNTVQPDFIVKACDPKGLFLTNLNKICFELKIPFISMAYSYDSIKIGPLYVPEVTSCSEALSNYAADNFGDHYRIENFERLFEQYLFHPSISFNINILASLVFKEILFFLIEEFDYCQTIGRLVVFNPLNLSTDSFLIICQDQCQICK